VSDTHAHNKTFDKNAAKQNVAVTATEFDCPVDPVGCRSLPDGIFIYSIMYNHVNLPVMINDKTALMWCDTASASFMSYVVTVIITTVTVSLTRNCV